MPKVSEMKNSKFLKKEDVGEDGTIVTVVNVHQVNVAMEGDAEDMKWCMTFREFEKPMVLNTTNAQLCEKFLNSDDTDDWTGKQIVIYDDPSVSFGGKPVGGIRVKRAPSGKGPASRPPTQRPAPKDDDGTDDVPWPAE
jgi:hypothetical protein